MCRAVSMPANVDAPIILLGRGGSGTRMLSETVQTLGVFLGNRVNATGDSIEWVEPLYELAIERLGSDVPASGERDRYWRNRLRQVAADVLTTGHGQASDSWGWKLPETMMTLAPILEAFPGACVIHLVRHPVPSALRRTHMTSRMDNPIGRAVLPAAYRFCGLDPSGLSHDEIYVHNAATWAFQLSAVLDLLRTSKPPVLQIFYEDMCLNPRDTRTRIANFLNLDVPVGSIVPDVDVTRTNDGLFSDERARFVWSICGRVASALGYDASGCYHHQAALA